MSAAEPIHETPAAGERSVPAPAEIGEFGWRVLVLLNLFRLVIGGTLLAAFLWIPEPRIVGEAQPEFALIALIAMLAFSAAALLPLKRRRPNLTLQTYVQFGADLAGILALIHSSGGISSGFGGLLVVSVGSLGLLVRRDQAFGLAAAATLGVLGEHLYAQFAGRADASQLAQAGILGAVIFVITGVVQLLRHRIVETEALAAQRGVDLRNQVELNAYIIQHLRESIIVVDGHSHVRLINSSAANHLGVEIGSTGRDLASLSPDLAAHLDRWRHHRTDLDTEPLRLASSDGSTTVQPHYAPVGGSRNDAVVIFLEDTSLIAERVQQTKLAALGRLSASIAHEIRNPLGALSHAGQLLAESEQLGPADQRLTDIIRINSKRVSNIVESVLALSKRDTTAPKQLELRTWLHSFMDEFVRTQELFEGSLALTAEAAEVDVRIDPTHLHQVLWNLCDNAVKYASAAAGAIAVELTTGTLDSSGRPYVDVADRGPGVNAEKVEHIFEPFYTGQPGGTGLGLFICRELCERNGAQLRYSARPGGGSLFRIVFADPGRWQTSRNPA